MGTVFTGSGVAIITPFKADAIDFVKLGELIEAQIKGGSDAIVICGTTGEASTMPDEEHLSAIGFAVREVAGRLPVIAGTGSNDTAHAVALTRKAEALGADAVLSVTPYYNKTNQDGLVRHFKAIADSISIPVILYNVPSRTNLNLEPDTLRSLSEVRNIVGVKECNFAQVPDILGLCGDRFDIYSGEDGLIFPMLAYGAKGVISAMANLLPREAHDIVSLYMAGDLAGSRALQLKVTPLVKALFSDVSPMPLKRAMNMAGMAVGECRLPLTAPTQRAADLLKAEMAAYGLI